MQVKIRNKKIPITKTKIKGALGMTYFTKDKKPSKIQINVKKHKGDKAELASTIKHELLHAKYPNMTEATVYKRSRKTKMSTGEKKKMLAVLKYHQTNAS